MYIAKWIHFKDVIIIELDQTAYSTTKRGTKIYLIGYGNVYSKK